MNIPPCRLVILAAIASFCANWSFAFQITYVNTSVDTFYKLARKAYRESRSCFTCQLPETDWLAEWSVTVSMFYPGTILGFLMVPVLTKWMGVKRAQGVMCLAATLGVAVHFLAVSLLSLGEVTFTTILSVGRLLIGLQAGSSLCLLPLYIIEISPAQYRSFLNNFQQVSQSFATLLGLVLGSEEILPLGNSRFTIMQIFAVVPVLFLLFLLIITPPTPNYLTRFHPECIHEAITSRLFYHGTERSNSYRPLISSYEMMEDKINSKYASYGKSWRDSFKGFLIGAVVAASYAFTADDLIDTFSSNMLIGDVKNPKRLHQSTDAFTVLVSDALGLVLFIASLLGIYLADRYGRRLLVLVGLFGTCIANIGAVVFTSNKTVVAFCFAATKAFIGIGCGGPAWFLTSELVDPDYAWIFQPLSTGILLSTTMIETFFYLSVDALIGSYSLLVLAAGPALMAAIIIYLYLPETKERSSEEVGENSQVVLLAGSSV
uniref:MFS domain-containing protein n=1 Tax=Caenorhabditis tropicalis TaxID=1561998 RepID=A0A1I7TJ77_9PELO